MSEYSASQTPEYIQRSSVKIYYDAIRVYENDPLHVQWIIEEFIETLPFATDETLETLFDHAFYTEKLEREPQIAKEDLILLPIRHFETAIDASDCSMEEVAEWYKNITRYIVGLTKDIHSQECSEQNTAYQYDFRCESSAECPHRRLEYLLTHDVAEPNFESDTYQASPQRAVSIALLKIDLAKAYEIVPPEFALTLRSRYCDMHRLAVKH